MLPSVSVREIAQFVGKTTATLRAIALQSSPDANELCTSPELQSGGNIRQVQHNTDINCCQQGGSGDLLNIPNGNTDSPSRPINNGALRCIHLGLGRVLNGQTHTGGTWSAEEAAHHINYLELLAAFLAFGKNWQNTTALLRMDNVTAVSYINQKGGTVSKALSQLAITIWTWCIERDITLQAEHLPGHLNSQANEESRTVRDRCDWMLNQSVFQRINAAMGPLEVDFFALGLTRQLPHFYSWRPDPEAEATDAFMQNWTLVWGFANPPWCLINHCLTKVRKQSAQIVLVTPLWKTQPWFLLVLELEDYSRRIPQQPDLVSMPVGQEFLMQQGVPKLIAWPISGNHVHHEEFLRRVQISCLHHGGTKPTPTMAPHSLSGLAGVSGGSRSPYRTCRGCSKFLS